MTLLFVLITLLAFLLTVAIVAYVLARNPRSYENHLFAFLSLVLGVWYIGTSFQLAAANEVIAGMWFRIATLGWFFPTPILVHFILAFTENKAYMKHKWFILFIYLPAPILTTINFTTNFFFSGFVLTEFGWCYVQSMSPLAASAWVYASAMITFAFVLLVRLLVRAVDPKIRVQARILIASLSISMVLYGASTILGLALDMKILTNIGQVSSIGWIFGVGWAIMRHRFLIFSPENAAFEIFTTMADGVLLVDRNHIVLNANPAAYAILGKTEDTLAKYRLEDVFSDASSSLSLFGQLETSGTIRDMEIKYHAEGRDISLSLSASRMSGRWSGNGIVIVLRDISERKMAEEQLHHMATHDILTNLPNRILLNDRLKNAIARAERYKNHLAVIFIDVDRFKEVNDQHGHDAGDILLKEVGQRLVASVREYDTVSRLGGDEFVVVLTDLTSEKNCSEIIERIRSGFNAPVKIGQFELPITLSMGASIYPFHAETSEDLYKLADIALYKVKSEGRNGFRIYSPEDATFSHRNVAFERDLRSAIGNGELELYYQPIYELPSVSLTAMETLLRWNHPTLGLVKPLDFIPLAERTGFIIQIGEWVLETACRQLAQWNAQGISIRLAINVSARQFMDPSLVEKVLSALERNHLDPAMIELEFTESTAMVDVKTTLKRVSMLKEHGIAIVIDDFGSGFSSMAWVKHLNAKAIKIDRFFIQNLARDNNDVAIVKAIVAMAHSLGMKVVAEGVETEEQLETIRSMRWEHSEDLSCDYVQGFLFSKPVPAAATAALFRKHVSR